MISEEGKVRRSASRRGWLNWLRWVATRTPGCDPDLAKLQAAAPAYMGKNCLKHSTPLKIRLWGFVKESERGCWEWQRGVSPYGYALITAPLNAGCTHASRVAWRVAYGPMGAMHVCHKCDNPLCVRPSHLFLGTNDDNIADKMAKGRHRGPSLKIPDHVMAESIRLFREGKTKAEIARRFGISESTAFNFVCGRRSKDRRKVKA